MASNGPAALAADGGAEEIHVLLRGEELRAMPAPPVAGDRPFDPPVWGPEAALPELIRAPLTAGDPTFQGRKAIAIGRPAVASSGLRPAEGRASLSAPEPALPNRASLRDPLPEPLAESAPAPAPGWQEMEVIRDAPPVAVAPSLRPEPDAPEGGGLGGGGWDPDPAWYSAARLAVAYRPGHRLEAGVSLGIGIPGVTAGLEMTVAAPDDLVPSPLSAAAGLLARLRVGTALRRGTLAAEVSTLLHGLSDGVESRAATSALKLSLGVGELSLSLDTGLVATRRSDTGSGLWSLHQGALARIAITPAVAVRFGMDGEVARDDVPQAAGHLLAALEVALPNAPIVVAGGLALRASGAGGGVLPVVGISLDRSPGFRLGLEVGPEAGYPADLPSLLAREGTPAGAPVPERAGVARLTAMALVAESLTIDTELSYADGRLWVLVDRLLSIASARALAGTVAAEVPVGRGGALRLAVSSAVCWLDGFPAGLSALTGSLSVRLGFWSAGLAAILRPAGRPWGAGLGGTGGSFTQDLDWSAGPQLVVELSRSLPGGVVLSAEARLLPEPETRGAMAAIRIGGSLGVR